MYHLLRNVGSSIFILLSVITMNRTSSENYVHFTGHVNPFNEALRDFGVSSLHGYPVLPILEQINAVMVDQAQLIGNGHVLVLGRRGATSFHGNPAHEADTSVNISQDVEHFAVSRHTYDRFVKLLFECDEFRVVALVPRPPVSSKKLLRRAMSSSVAASTASRMPPVSRVPQLEKLEHFLCVKVAALKTLVRFRYKVTLHA